jgi:hypothetical protein
MCAVNMDNSLAVKYEPTINNKNGVQMKQANHKSLYHNRTHAVTEAYASIPHFEFKALENSYLICGIFFCNQ